MIRVPDNTRKQDQDDPPRPSHVYWNGNMWYVAQVVNGETKYYGYYKTLREAINRRDTLVQEGVITSRAGKHRIKNFQNRYIYKHKDKYYLKKVVNKQPEHFGTFNTLEEARQERDFLESINWDYTNMDNGITRWGGYDYDKTKP